MNLRTLREDQISSQQSATEWNVKKTRCENLVGSMQVAQDGKMFAQTKELTETLPYALSIVCVPLS